MIKDREPINLGQPFHPFIEGNNQIAIQLAPNGPFLPIDFKVTPIQHSSLAGAGFFECVGATLLHPLALTTKEVNGDKVYLDPARRLDLSVQTPGMPVAKGKIRAGLYEERRLEWWFYDPSLWMPRLKTPHFLPPTLPVLATPGFLGEDPNYRLGESYGGKFVVSNTPEDLANIEIKFSLTDLAALPKILEAKRQLWRYVADRFNWGVVFGDTPEKGLVRAWETLADSGLLEAGLTDKILQLIGTVPSRSADELIAQAEEFRVSAQRWALRKRAQLSRIFREQEDSFRM